MENNIYTLITELYSDDVRVVSAALKRIRQNPTGDTQLQQAIKSLLADTRILIKTIKPIRYGEIAWEAGLTLSYEQAKAKNKGYIQVPTTFAPLTQEEINQLSDSEDTIEARKQGGGVERLIRILDKKGKLKRTGFTFAILEAELALKRQGII